MAPMKLIRMFAPQAIMKLSHTKTADGSRIPSELIPGQPSQTPCRVAPTCNTNTVLGFGMTTDYCHDRMNGLLNDELGMCVSF